MFSMVLLDTGVSDMLYLFSIVHKRLQEDFNG